MTFIGCRLNNHEWLTAIAKNPHINPKNGFEAIDGLGVVRIAEKINNEVKKKLLVDLDNRQELHEDNFVADIIK